MYSNNTRPNPKQQSHSSPRYREANRGNDRSVSTGRGRDPQKKQNVWARRTPPTTNPESDFMSKFGLETQTEQPKKESVESVTQQLNTLSVEETSETPKQSNTRNKPREDKPATNGAHTDGSENYLNNNSNSEWGKKHPANKNDDSKGMQWDDENVEEWGKRPTGPREDRRPRPAREKKQYQPTQQSSSTEAEDDAANERSRMGRVKLSLAEWLPTVNYNPDEDGIAETPSRILWVGNIGPDVSEEELEQEFGQFGKIESLRILHNRFCAFVNFEVEESAREAKKNLHGTIIGSQYIVIHYRKPDQAKPVTPGTPDANFQLNNPSRALWIGNISDEVTEDELLSEFQRYGAIESIRVLRAKTCAFVNFMTAEEASNALHALQGKKLGNMAIKINFGKPQSALPKSMTPDMSQPYAMQPSMQPGYMPEYAAPYMTGMPPGMPPFGMFPPQYYPMMEPYQMGYAEQMGYEQMYDPNPMYIPNAASFCELCMANFKEAAFQPCGHSSCNQCFAKLRAAAADKPTKCPWCAQQIQKIIPVAVQLVTYPPVMTYQPPAPPQPQGY